MVLRVAVVGGGAAGIVATKRLKEKGLSVVVFEKSPSVGGVWKYDADTSADSCTYQSLRTNLPTAVMQFKGFPYPAELPSYPSHVDVLQYIKSYAEHFKVDEVIRLNSSVTKVYKSDKNDSVWRVCVSSLERGDYEEEVDRVVVCNGHFSVPFCAPVKGIENFRGAIAHSKTYRTPEGYAGKTILVIGRGPSGGEISRELANNGAASVVVSSQKGVPETESGNPNQSANVANHASVDRVEPDGTVVLTDGTKLPPGSVGPTPERLELAVDDKRVLKPEIDFVCENGHVHFVDRTSIASPDVIMFCTGYKYAAGNFLPADLLFPGAGLDLTSVGLEPELSAEVTSAVASGRAVAPLYKQVFAIEDPTLAFVGLPFDTATFQCFELQSVWISSVFSGLVALPSKEEMFADFCKEIRQAKPPVGKNIHALGLKHFPYFSDISALSNCALDLVDLALFGDAAFLLFNFENFRSASYTQDPDTKTWTRRVTPKDSGTELVKMF